MVAGQIPVVIIFRIILSQQIGDLIAENAVQLRGAHILVSSHTLLDALDDFQGGVHTDITRYQHLFQIVKHIVVNL